MKYHLCDNKKENKKYLEKEIQQGLREEFEYIKCLNCGYLFIKEILANMSKYDINYALMYIKIILDKIINNINLSIF